MYRTNRAIVLEGGPICFYCRAAPATTADHYMPVQHGGTDDLDNLRPACWPCNHSKRDKMPWEWKPHTGALCEPGDW